MACAAIKRRGIGAVSGWLIAAVAAGARSQHKAVTEVHARPVRSADVTSRAVVGRQDVIRCFTGEQHVVVTAHARRARLVVLEGNG